MTTATRKPRRALTPVTVTSRFPSFNGKRLENWSAETRDGNWLLIREESAGTPWLTIHRETRTEVGLHGTLRAARVFIADGHADDQLALLQAHERGEHADRDPRCVRC